MLLGSPMAEPLRQQAFARLFRGGEVGQVGFRGGDPLSTVKPPLGPLPVIMRGIGHSLLGGRWVLYCAYIKEGRF